MFPEQIESNRLIFERISHRFIDVFDLYELYSEGDDTEEIFEYWDTSPHETVKETYDYIDEAERLWDEGAGAKYVIRPKAEEDGAGLIAGTTRLNLNWQKRSANLGILLEKRYWGRGYSGERADALLSVAFDRLDLELVVAVHIDGNEKSRRAITKYIERYGGQYEGQLRNWLSLSDSVVDVHRYSISHEEYRAEADN